jgi:lipopolysaccharide/colanic/teichoic acid biosynthesis glycosyltransferase
MQQVGRFRRLLHPRYGRHAVAFAFASGEVLGVAAPYLAGLGLVGSLAAAPEAPALGALGVAGCLLYAAAAVRLSVPEPVLPWPVEGLLRVAGDHLAGLVGASRYLLGLERGGPTGGRAVREAAGRPASARVARAEGGPPRGTHIHVLVAAGKRGIDIAVALLLLLVTAPLFPLIALAIRLDSPGPVFFRQLRIGERRPELTVLFHMIKFRTMRPDAEAGGAVLATKHDPRVTRVGGFLRCTRLDELPQLVNVLRGEMSLIGPRPERPGIFRWLDVAIPYYGERMYGVKPGITGFAQVVQGYDETIDDVRSKLNFDHAYALALSRPRAWLALEFAIIAWTVLVMVRRAGQ